MTNNVLIILIAIRTNSYKRRNIITTPTFNVSLSGYLVT